MTTIVTRAGKGTPLTYAEMDANFTNLNNDKLETSSGAARLPFTPSGSIAATNTQAAIEELDTETVKKTSTTGSAILPVGTTAERDGSPQNGYIRYNTTLNRYEGYGNSVWAAIGAGATGGGSDTVFFVNKRVVNNPFTIASDEGAYATGPITYNAAVTVDGRLVVT